MSEAAPADAAAADAAAADAVDVKLQEPAAPQPERMSRTSRRSVVGRTYGSEAGVGVGDIVEVRLDGVWSDEPFTIVTETNGKFVVKEGVAGAPDFTIEGEPRWSPDVHIGNVPDLLLSFPSEVRAGIKFKEVIDRVPLPTFRRQRVKALQDDSSSFLVETQLTGVAAAFACCATACSCSVDALNDCLECKCCPEWCCGPPGMTGSSPGGW